MQIPDRMSFTRAIEALMSPISAASQIIAVISGSLTPIDSPSGEIFAKLSLTTSESLHARA
jgi:hypothetical protein